MTTCMTWFPMNVSFHFLCQSCFFRGIMSWLHGVHSLCISSWSEPIKLQLEFECQKRKSLILPNTTKRPSQLHPHKPLPSSIYQTITRGMHQTSTTWSVSFWNVFHAQCIYFKPTIVTLLPHVRKCEKFYRKMNPPSLRLLLLPQPQLLRCGSSSCFFLSWTFSCLVQVSHQLLLFPQSPQQV